jgi:hypothetical protein
MTEFAPSWRCWACGKRGPREDLCFPVPENHLWSAWRNGLVNRVRCPHDVGSVDPNGQCSAT